MKSFKINDRVRCARILFPTQAERILRSYLIGAEGVIVSADDRFNGDWIVSFPKHAVHEPGDILPPDQYVRISDELEPLLPASDAQLMRFMEIVTRKPDPVQPAVPNKEKVK